MRAERHAQGVLLGVRKRVELGEHRCAQAVQPSERQFHLGLDARDLGHSEPGGLPCGVPDERRLADPGLTAYEEDGALALAGSLEQPVEHTALPGPAQKHRRALDGHSVSLTPVDNASKGQGATLPSYAAYAASMGAVDAITPVLARELSARDITVNAIAPALERPAAVADVAELVAFLVSVDGRRVNGQVIRAGEWRQW
jgi:hypothetical protein